MHKCKAQTARVRGEIEKVGTIIAAAKKRNAEECERIVRCASLDATTKTEKQVDMLVQEQQKIADDVRQNTMQEVQNITMLDSEFVKDMSKCIVEKFVASDTGVG